MHFLIKVCSGRKHEPSGTRSHKSSCLLCVLLVLKISLCFLTIFLLHASPIQFQSLCLSHTDQIIIINQCEPSLCQLTTVVVRLSSGQGSSSIMSAFRLRFNLIQITFFSLVQNQSVKYFFPCVVDLSLG